MKNEILYLKTDDRARISLKKLSKEIAQYYKAYIVEDKIILEPIKENKEDWLFKTENKQALESLQKGLKQKGTIKRGSFSKYLKD